jgi:hypothetical protein
MISRKHLFSLGQCLVACAILLPVGPALAQRFEPATPLPNSLGQEVERQEAEGLETEEGEEAEEGEIETDRDSFTPATTTVRRGGFMLESSYSIIDNESVPETHSFPEILTRYGLTDRLELRFGWNYEIGGAVIPFSGNLPEPGATGTEIEEGAKLLYGAKYLMTQQSGWTPQSAIIIEGRTPTLGESNLTTVGVTPVFGWNFDNGWTWDSATRFGTSGKPETQLLPEDRFNVWEPSTVIKIPLNERVKAHVEYIGVFSDGRDEETTQNYFSPGVHYLINRDFEVGVRVAWGLNEEAPDFFSNIGFGWQF